ncbi:hypothetical protein B0J14DRAFT_642568, partial [Halenospora varia]
MRPRDSLKVGDGVEMSAHLIAIAKNQERFFGPKYDELPKKKLTSLKKWSDWAKEDDLRYSVKRGVDFMEEIERCISGELRLLLEMSGDELPEKLFSRFDENDIPDLRAYWNETVHSDGLKETYALFKEGKLSLPEEVYEAGSERPRKRARKQKTSTEVNLEPESVPVTVDTQHVLRFLLNYPGLYPSAQMKCPILAEVHPSVEIRYQIPNSRSFEFVKIEFSHGLCTNIVEDRR